MAFEPGVELNGLDQVQPGKQVLVIARSMEYSDHLDAPLSRPIDNDVGVNREDSYLVSSSGLLGPIKGLDPCNWNLSMISSSKRSAALALSDAIPAQISAMSSSASGDRT